MAHMRLYHKETGKHVDVWSVDAKELLASGEYATELSDSGVQEGVPGETVFRPFDPTLHRENPASHVGDMVVTEPMPSPVVSPTMDPVVPVMAPPVVPHVTPKTGEQVMSDAQKVVADRAAAREADMRKK